MTKPLTEMSLQELWQLFPIQLTPHRPQWRDWYAEEARQLQNLLRDYACSIAHIGSTAIPGIWAKPIIDILIEVADKTALQNAATILTAHGYLQMFSISIYACPMIMTNTNSATTCKRIPI